MGIVDSTLVRALSEKMKYLGQRQSVLAQNIANANTPNFKAQDLAPFTFAQALQQTNPGMKTTDARHIVPASLAGVNAKATKMKSYETLPSGTAVDLEQQMMEVSKTAVDYQALIAIYHKYIGLFRSAIGRS